MVGRAEEAVDERRRAEAGIAWIGLYGQPDKKTAMEMEARGKQQGRKLACEGPECRWVTGYRDRLFAEEKQP